MKEKPLTVARNYQEMSRRAAAFITAEIRQRPDLLLCASSGGTPTLTYRMLGECRSKDPSLFERLRVIKIDEWAGLQADHPASCQVYLRQELLRPLGIRSGQYVGFRGDASDAQAECRRVARWLDRHGPIDICVLGLGRNGHIALNEPAAALPASAHVVKLSHSSQQHPMLCGAVHRPTLGLTLGMGDILRSRRILLLVSGHHKRIILRRLMQAEVSTRFPASFLWLHPDVTIICDRQAAP